MGKQRDIFISYSSKNMKVAEDIREYLEQNGFTWWMAPYCIAGGSDYAEAIMDGISVCKVFLLVLTEEAQLSPHVRRELECAINSNKVIVPIHMDKSVIQKTYRYHLSVNQIIDANNRKIAAYREMLETIEALDGVERRTRTSNAEETKEVEKIKESVTKPSAVKETFLNARVQFNYMKMVAAFRSRNTEKILNSVRKQFILVKEAYQYDKSDEWLNNVVTNARSYCNLLINKGELEEAQRVMDETIAAYNLHYENRTKEIWNASYAQLLAGQGTVLLARKEYAISKKMLTCASLVGNHLLKNKADQDETVLYVLVMDCYQQLTSINFQENNFYEARRNCLQALDVAEKLEKDDTTIEMLKKMGLSLEEYIGARKDELRVIEEKQLELYDPDDRVLIKSESQKIRPQDACPCGSGKKYENCCGRR